ncbi:MAG: hypothetical protein JW981_03710 [Anaerolineae bacterium]|nr:hypothetical protein [Anaerolineae bacterium]
MSDTGGGHRASAKAVRDEMVTLYGDAVQVEIIDVFVELGLWPFKCYPTWYPHVVKLQGIPWGIGYYLSDKLRLLHLLAYLDWMYVRGALRGLLDRYPADVLVSFHAMINPTLSMALRRKYWSRPVASIAIDLVSVHSAWFTPGFDLYVVASDGAKARAQRCGTPEECIKIAGMPVRRDFKTAADISQEQARLELGLPQDEPVVLVVGGGGGMGPVTAIVQTVLSRCPGTRVVVIAGGNRKLYEQLKALNSNGSLQVEGFTSNMPVWMRAADILVTKAGPNTLSEAFITGLPLVLYMALPGQERGSIPYVVSNGAGVWAATPEKVAVAVQELVTDTSRRQALASGSRSLARPLASEQIAQYLWSLA